MSEAREWKSERGTVLVEVQTIHGVTKDVVPSGHVREVLPTEQSEINSRLHSIAEQRDRSIRQREAYRQSEKAALAERDEARRKLADVERENKRLTKLRQEVSNELKDIATKFNVWSLNTHTAWEGVPLVQRARSIGVRMAALEQQHTEAERDKDKAILDASEWEVENVGLQGQLEDMAGQRDEALRKLEEWKQYMREKDVKRLNDLFGIVDESRPWYEVIASGYAGG